MGVKRALGLTIAALALALGLGGCSLPKIVTPGTKAETSETQQTQDYEESERLAQERQDKTFDYYNSLGLNLPKLKVSDYQGFEQIKPSLEQKLGFPIPSLKSTDDIRRLVAIATKGEKTTLNKLAALREFIYSKSEIDTQNEYSIQEIAEMFFKDSTLKGDCFSLSKLCAVSALMIPGVQEAYVCEVIKDIDGKDYRIKRADKKYPGHGCNLIKLDEGEWIIIDVSKYDGWRKGYKELRILNQLDIACSAIIGEGEEARLNCKEFSVTYDAHENALKLDPDNLDALSFFVWQLPKDQDSKAFLYAVKANGLSPDDYYYLGVMAYAYKRIDEFDFALQKIDESIAICPEFFPSYYIRSLVLYDLKRFEEAKDDIEKAIDSDPDNLLYSSQMNRITAALKRR